MKLSKQWKTLTRDQKRSWRTWARNNRVILDNGQLRRVSGQKAFTMVLNNRGDVGEAASPTVIPAPVAWLDGALGVDDAGPFTENAGFIGFRANQDIPGNTKWFVWATPPVSEDIVNPRPLLRFVTRLSLSDVAHRDVIYINAAYLAVNGDWHGPGQDGEWPEPMCVWFRVHQYANGQLSPGVVLKGRIQVEL